MTRGMAASASLFALLICTPAAGFATQDAHAGHSASGQAPAAQATAAVQLPARSGNDALPAGEEQASEALQKSPRHGEWADIKVPGGQQTVRTWVVYPERKDKAPVVIVIQEIFGLTDWIRTVADQLARDGFIALAPDLLSGKGPNG
ncbi:MAG TPA: dienelactone hydrolase family protein, partial [Vicinamibacterales bacterium]|nr:dienelactone hydrolase family protein [Vicinamibacterales bacterium]